MELSTDTIGTAVAAAKVTQTGSDIKLTLNYGLKQAGAYPLGLVTYEITCQKGLPAAQSKLVKSFLTYTSSDEGQDAAAAGRSRQAPQGSADQGPGRGGDDQLVVTNPTNSTEWSSLTRRPLGRTSSSHGAPGAKAGTAMPDDSQQPGRAPLSVRYGSR